MKVVAINVGGSFKDRVGKYFCQNPEGNGGHFSFNLAFATVWDSPEEAVAVLTKNIQTFNQDQYALVPVETPPIVVRRLI